MDACYRFTRKLREHKGTLDACIASVLTSLHNEIPEFGQHVAIDGRTFLLTPTGSGSPPRAGGCGSASPTPTLWGHRSAISTRKGGGYYGYKLHAAVCTTTGLPVAWETHTAKDAEVPVVPSLLDSVRANGFSPATVAMDKGYNTCGIYDELNGDWRSGTTGRMPRLSQ